MEKVGGMLHNEKMEDAGSERRAKAGGYGDDSGFGGDSYGSGSRDNDRSNY
jgi:hypothetical protein